MLKRALIEENRVEDYENLISLLGPPRDITKIASPGAGKGVKVGIIGGGLAGLSSAFELRKLGFDITIFEMEGKRIGGRVYTYYFDKEKLLYGELGAMRIPVSHESSWHYINTFNLKTRPFIQENENAFIYVRNKRVRNDPDGKNVMEKIYPEFNLTPQERNTSWKKLLDYALTTPLLKLDPSIRKELLQARESYSKEINFLGSFSTRQVFERLNLSEAAIEMLSGLDPFTGTFYTGSYNENMLDEYTVDNSYRYEIVGGTSKLPLAFYNSLMSTYPKEYKSIEKKDLGKVVYKNGKRVSSIYRCNNNKVTLEYKDEMSLESCCETFDFVICTIPFSSLRSVNIYPMFSNEKMQAIKEFNYESAHKTLFLCNERFWERGNERERIIGGGSVTDLSIQTTWYPAYPPIANIDVTKNEKSKINKLYNKFGVITASYNMGQDAMRLGNVEIKTRIEIIKRQVEAVNGLPKGYLDSVVDDYESVLWDNVQGVFGGFAYFMPEQQRLFAYASVKAEYDFRVFFAGEHTSLKHGWMQGALNSGMNAANSIAEQLKLHLENQ
ncbi:flavin monoamine oxidase family protein [Clostridium cylindrosporum]|nr:FAD-dependent oxidoreductase [Clostridium cylindrosporum]